MNINGTKVPELGAEQPGDFERVRDALGLVVILFGQSIDQCRAARAALEREDPFRAAGEPRRPGLGLPTSAPVAIAPEFQRHNGPALCPGCHSGFLHVDEQTNPPTVTCTLCARVWDTAVKP